MFVLGAMAAYGLLLRLAKKTDPEIPRSWLSELFCIAYVSGYFGARLFSIFVDEAEIRGTSAIFAAMFRLGPMTFYGGALSAFLFGSLYAKWRGLSIARLLDLCIPAGFIGLSLGRLGCFLNGDDYGLPVMFDLSVGAPWWSVAFPNLQDGVPRYPVQIFESVYAASSAAGLYFLFPILNRRFAAGTVAAIGVSGYAIFRFFLEYWRADERGWVVRNVLSPAQFISVIIFAVVVMILLARVKEAYGRRST